VTCGGCGGNIDSLNPPLTSGDMAEAPPEVAPEDATHLVITSGTPEGGAVESYYGSYRDASIAWHRAGGDARLRRVPR
jgi:hypothetical protein